MSPRIQLVSILVAVAIFLFVIDLVRKKRLAEEYSVFWLAASIGMLAIALWKEAFFFIAALLGIANSVSLIVLVLIVAFAAYSIHLSIRSSQLMDQNRELIQWIGLLRHRIERLENHIVGEALSDQGRPQEFSGQESTRDPATLTRQDPS